MPTITPEIVVLNVSVIEAPVPSQLQQSGAIVSVGGTDLDAGTSQYVATLADFLALLNVYGDSEELTKAGTTYFAQGSGQGVYLLELGEGADAADLGTWIAENPNVFYAYLVPSAWDNSAELKALVSQYAAPDKLTYFFITSTLANKGVYEPNKSAFVFVQSPVAAETEFQAAEAFWQWLNNDPSASNILAPMAYRYAYGVTPYPITGGTNRADVISILSAYANIIGDGAEGGISTAILRNGTLADGSQASWWFGIDWFQIQVEQALAAAIINGSNSNANPLLYNQSGINRLLAVAQQVANNGIAFGCLQAAELSAIPFATYIEQNPSDYAAGIYNGLSATVSGQSGFLTITFNIDAVQFAL